MTAVAGVGGVLWLVLHLTLARTRMRFPEIANAVGDSASGLPRESFVANDIQNYYELRLAGLMFDKAIVEVDRGTITQISATRNKPIELREVEAYCAAVAKENATHSPSLETRTSPSAGMWCWQAGDELALLLVRKSTSRDGEVEAICLILADAADRDLLVESRWSRWSK